MDENAGAIGCATLIFFLVISLVVAPGAYGGAVHIIFGIDDMSYGAKWVGGLSGSAIPAYLIAWTLKPYLPAPFVQLPYSQ